MDSAPIKPRNRRGGVSAETYSEEDAATYVRKVSVYDQNSIKFSLLFGVLKTLNSSLSLSLSLSLTLSHPI